MPRSRLPAEGELQGGVLWQWEPQMLLWLLLFQQGTVRLGRGWRKKQTGKKIQQLKEKLIPRRDKGPPLPFPHLLRKDDDLNRIS